MLLVPESGSEEHLKMLSSLSPSLVREEARGELHATDAPERVQKLVLGAVS